MDQLLLPQVLPTLHSQRLTLRAMHDRDAVALLAIYGDPLVMRYTDEDPFPDLDTVGLMLKSVRRLLANGESLEWAVALRDGDDLIGTCGLHSVDSDARTAEIGCMSRQSAWGKGYMSEAIVLLMHFAREVLRLNRLTADVAPENERAQCLFKQLGYTHAPSGMLGIDLAATP